MRRTRTGGAADDSVDAKKSKQTTDNETKKSKQTTDNETKKSKQTTDNETKKSKQTTDDEMKTRAYWTRQCDMATAGMSGVRLMTTGDWIAEYDVNGQNEDLFEGFRKLYERFNREGLGREEAALIPRIEDVVESPVLCGGEFYDGIAVYFVLVQEEEGARLIKNKTRKTQRNVKAGWPLAFALVYRLWPKLETDTRAKLPFTYLCHLAADANFAGFGKMLINLLKNMFSDTVVCLEISIDDSDKYSISRQRAIFNLGAFYESLGFIFICNLEEESQLKKFFAGAYRSKWMNIKVSGFRPMNLLDVDPTKGKWMVLPPTAAVLVPPASEKPQASEKLLASEKLGLYRSHVRRRR